MTSAKPQVVITGGAGFIGSHLAERLLSEGRRVLVVDDFSTGNRANLAGLSAFGDALEIVESKVSQWRGLAQALGASEYVVHLAAAVGVELVVRSPVHTIENNLSETEALLKAAAGTSTPVLLASTSEVYGRSSAERFSEEDDLIIGRPDCQRWGYACSKLMDEFMAMAYSREYALPVVIARLFNTVGPRQSGDYGMALPRFIHAARQGVPIQVYGDGRQSRTFCYVADTVEALIRLMGAETARGQVVNIGGIEEIQIRDLARRVRSVLGSNSPIELVPYERVFDAGFEDMRRRRPNVDKLERLTGYRPGTGIDEIIRKTAVA